MTDKHWFDADWEAYRRGVDEGTITFDADTMDRPYYRHLVPCAVCGRTQAESTAHRSMDRLEFPAIRIVTPTEEEPMTEHPVPVEWKVGHVVSDTAGFFHQGMIREIREIPSENGPIVLYDVVYQDDRGYDRICTVTATRLIAFRKGQPARSETPSVADADHLRLKPHVERVENALYALEDAERSGKLQQTVVSEGVWTALGAVHELLTVVRSRL